MATNKLLNEIVSYGLQNKKKKNEIMTALLKSGQVEVGAVATAMKNLEDLGAFDYGEDNQKGILGKPETQQELEYQVKEKKSIEKTVYDTERALLALDSLEKHKGFSAAGAPISMSGRTPFGTIPGTAAKDFELQLGRFKSALAVPQLENLRGLGAMSERELAVVTDAVAALSIDMSEDELKNEMERIRGVLADTIDRTKTRQNELFGGVSSATGADSSVIAAGTQQPAQGAQQDVSPLQKFNATLQHAQANPNDPKAQKFLDMIKKGDIDPVTGIMKGSTQIQDSRKKAVLGLVQQGITDPNEMLKIFDEQNRAQGYKSSDFTVDEIKGHMQNKTVNEEQNGQTPYGTSEQNLQKWANESPEAFDNWADKQGWDGQTKDRIKQAQGQEQKTEERPLAKKIGDFLGITKFGEGIGTAMFLKTKEGKDLQKKAEQGDKYAVEALQQILDEAPNAKELIGSAAMTALNVASVGIAGRATTAGKVIQGAATGYGFDVASNLQDEEKTIEEAIKPGIGTVVGGAIPIIGAIKNAFARSGQKVAERVMNSVVKPNIDDIEKSILYNGKTLGREMLDEGMKGTKRTIFKKAATGLAENEGKLQKILNGSTAIIKREELFPYLSKLKDKLIKTPTQRAQKALQTIDDAVNLFPEKFNLSQANELKRNLYSELRDLAYKLDPNLSPTAETSKALAGGLKDLIEKKASNPTIAVINKKLSTFMKVQDGMLDQLARTQRNNLAGVGTVGAIIEKTLGATAIKTYGSALINKAAKILEKTGSGTGGKITKVMILNAIEKAKRDSSRQ